MARYIVRSEGHELTVESLRELRTLYLRQFVGDEDEVRREGTDRWQKAGLMPDLQSAKPRPYFHGFEFAWLVLAIVLGTFALWFLVHK